MNRGPVILLGHVDSDRGPAVCHQLAALAPGNSISLRRADGRVVVFTVESVRRYPKSSFPVEVVAIGSPSPPTSDAWPARRTVAVDGSVTPAVVSSTGRCPWLAVSPVAPPARERGDRRRPSVRRLRDRRGSRMVDVPIRTCRTAQTGQAGAAPIQVPRAMGRTAPRGVA